jgi:hypothetical protein
VSDDDTRSLLVAGLPYDPPPGLSVTNFRSPSVEAFEGRSRAGRSVTELIIHETVTRSVETTVAVLRQRKLGVHLIVDADGSVTQHGDLHDARLAHAGGHNGPSVGIEVVTPYYPSRLKPADPWKRVVDAPWAHLGNYVVPTFEQAEATSKLIAWLTSDKATALQIPRTWIGYSDGRLQMGSVAGTLRLRQPGVYAHHYFNHADGLFPVLYAWLRLEAGLAPSTAYEEAIRRATGATKHIDVSDFDPVVAV